MRRIHLQPAYILHARPYQETSAILEVFTQDYGRFSVIAKGLRRHKNPAKALLQPFVSLLISCSGRGELLTLQQYETSAVFPNLWGRRLMSGFYLNEIVMRLLHRFDPHESLFHIYAETLKNLEQHPNEQGVLRHFEKALLQAIGYGLQLQKDCETELPIDPNLFYLFDPDRGPILFEESPDFQSEVLPRRRVYSGKCLIALFFDQFDDPKIMNEIKYLMRQALKSRLGDKPLKARELFG